MLRSGFRLGKIFGISIYIDWSWLFIFLLVTWNLAIGVFPTLHPAWSAALNWGTAVVAALLFFASVLAHELAHSVVAKARGLPVSRITLFLFGGVSNIEREPTSPSTEFIMAIVGPLTSLVLGIIFLVLGGISVFTAGQFFSGGPLGVLSSLGPISTLLLWLGPINIVLAIFNMVPGFPLDGGRVLRSILWAASHNLRLATRWASWIGQAVAWLLILAGISMVFGVQLPLFGTGLIGGLWLAFIGWFLNNAAVQSYRQVVLEDILEGVPVETLMRSDIASVPPEMPISDLVYTHIMGSEERSFPVVDGEGCLVGIVSLGDVRKVPRDEWGTRTVSQIMTPEEKLAVATPREDAAAALNDLTGDDVRQMPVVQEGRLVGMLRRVDIMRWLQLHSEFAAR
ncbi:MAG: site-2 protease family protein [Chloroflexi bacterium]|nr:site-2 protease family protein [Chloroflexota bacterium]